MEAIMTTYLFPVIFILIGVILGLFFLKKRGKSLQQPIHIKKLSTGEYRILEYPVWCIAIVRQKDGGSKHYVRHNGLLNPDKTPIESYFKISNDGKVTITKD